MTLEKTFCELRRPWFTLLERFMISVVKTGPAEALSQVKGLADDSGNQGSIP